MAFRRSSGILVHPTSFPSPHGIGDFGDGAYRFLDWLAAAGQHLWQIMPLVPTEMGDSPYSSPSAFAGNPLLISLERLAQEGLLQPEQIATDFGFPDERVEFDNVRGFKVERLQWAFARFETLGDPESLDEFETFRRAEAEWLLDFCRYMALKAAHGSAGWIDWDPPLAHRYSAALAEADERLAPEMRFHAFCQFIFRRQWRSIRDYAHDRDIQIIGDIPIFVAFDSADVWANRGEFILDGSGRPAVMAGVPPDYFSASGQLWGNPHYDWRAMAGDDYRWWVSRFRNILKTVDIIRIDHFRAFAAAWTVPLGAENASSGWWTAGPGRAVFDAAVHQLGAVPIIVEDLGLITPDVIALRRDLGYPGMAVLQFAFDGDPNNLYLPHNYVEPIVAYTGTHDNQTSMGWFQGLDGETRARAQRYLGADGHDIAWDFIRLTLASTAEFAIAPLQDVLRLGDDARMNVPGQPSGNWSWRYRTDQLDWSLAPGLAELTRIYGRERVVRARSGYDPFDYTAPGTNHALRDQLS